MDLAALKFQTTRFLLGAFFRRGAELTVLKFLVTGFFMIDHPKISMKTCENERLIFTVLY